MPVDRGIGYDLAQALADIYTDAQQRLAADIARRLAAGDPNLPAPEWAVRKLAALTELRRLAQQLIRQLDTDATGRIEQSIVLAYARGGHAALDELGRWVLTPRQTAVAQARGIALQRLVDLVLRRRARLAQAIATVRADLPGVDALQRLAFTLVAQVQTGHLRILRWALDSYRDVVAHASVPVLLGTRTRLQVAQVAWDRLLSQGVTGFVDRSGRRWELASYVEMATRSTTAQAAVQGHLDRIEDLDVGGLTIVSDAPQECVKCRPWEGKVLTVKGGPGARTVELTSVVTGRPVTVHVAGSVAQAIAAGLMHPNCRHSLSAFLPGATKIPTNTADPDGEAARVRQREIERTIRQWKLRQAGALTPDAKAAAGRKVRTWQAELRAHLDAHPELRRLRRREQTGTAR